MKGYCKSDLIFTVAFCFTVKCIISLSSFSGQNEPPIYGDYEAQRHWQELTVNIPISEWYINTTNNDLLYWGLDYPPLTAFHSLIIGKIAKRINSTYVALHYSRGISSDDHKDFMRISVLISDALIYVPAWIVTFFVQKYFTKWSILCILLYPGQLLIDNGHFQYNNMSLGLTLFAINFAIVDFDLLSAVFFSLALNYKQMELYHAIPFFVYLLRKCITFENKRKRHLCKLLKLGVAVLLTFFLLWCPWVLFSEDSFCVLKRIFPVSRGVFEDKVANFWCIFNTIVKIKNLFTNERMVLICSMTTLLGLLPSTIHLFWRPTKITFVYSLINVSLSFFLFSFQVHEKSILLPALPVLVIYPLDPFASFWFLQTSTFSMFPLFVKDGLTLSFLGTNIIFYCVNRLVLKKLRNYQRDAKISHWIQIMYYFFTAANSLLAIFYLFVPPPANLPHIFSLAISFVCFLQFLAFLCYFNLKQMNITSFISSTY